MQLGHLDQHERHDQVRLGLDAVLEERWHVNRL
jgi:hypothetical protein